MTHLCLCFIKHKGELVHVEKGDLSQGMWSKIESFPVKEQMPSGVDLRFTSSDSLKTRGGKKENLPNDVVSVFKIKSTVVKFAQ